MPKPKPKKRAARPDNFIKLDVNQDFDFNLPAYVPAKQLQAHVESLGIKYLHLTRPENAEPILKEGLRSEDGYLFFTDTAMTLAHVALNQVFTDEFHLFGLKHGKSWKFQNDDCAEMISRHQWIHRATHIPPDKLVDLGRWKAEPPLDQFIPYPPDARESLLQIKEMKEEERQMHLARIEKGMWPHGVLAYLTKIE